MELLTGDFLKWIFKDQAEFPYFQEYMEKLIAADSTSAQAVWYLQDKERKRKKMGIH